MPNYDYRCTNCGYTEEISQRMSDAPITKCPNCGKETFERLITGGAGVLYKGEGWYVTDYSKKSSGGKEKDSSTAPPPATSTPVAPAKTESKSEGS
ncbi:MAG: zinc ribbon domain-containing protein [Bacteroidota bacterium]|nr:zinc ribbon domain-containing protein [Bacteroidota bacterium]MDP4230420.1 zinc ribbon domain-containing protein [Bacteroidota bacterium]MDP4237376.1 zinc ribbon domain-containing protein [Bacteroidota bacterium]